MSLVKLTLLAGGMREVWVNPEHISLITHRWVVQSGATAAHSSPDQSTIYMMGTDDGWDVEGSPTMISQALTAESGAIKEATEIGD